MARLTKKQKALQGKIVAQKPYPVGEALALAKESATAKFDESIDAAVNLGVDPRKSDQVVRGSVVLPAGTGKSVRVAVFAQGDKAEAAKAAGASRVFAYRALFEHGDRDLGAWIATLGHPTEETP